MASAPVSKPSNLLVLLGLHPLSAYRVRSLIGVCAGVCLPLIFAIVGQNSGDWDLFERSGALTATIGLVMASRRYVEYSLLALAAPNPNEKQGSFADVIEDILTAKLGLGLSAFGTIIWGWGRYVGWWGFSYLVVWGFFMLRDAKRDVARLQNGRILQ